MRTVAYTGLGISLAGAALDFVSGYSMGSAAPVEMMSSAPPASAIALYLLGLAVLITGFLIVLPRISGAMRRLGLLMEVFGVAMALASAWVPGMNLGLSYAMLIVGAAMILNGALMQSKKTNAMGQG